METLLRDVRLAVRHLRKAPAFTLLSIASLAIGIGATTTVFSLVNAFLLRPLPLRGAGELVSGYQSDSTGRFHTFSYPEILDLRTRTHTLGGLAGVAFAPLSVSTGGDARVALGDIVSGNYFEVLGATPAMGRFFAPDEDSVPNAQPVAVVSSAFWRRQLGSDPQAIGRIIRLNGQPFTVIGVTRPDFDDVNALLTPEVFTPVMMAAVTRPGLKIDSRGSSTFQFVGRLAPGVTRDAAQRELRNLMRQIDAEQHNGFTRGVDLFPLTSLPAEMLRGVSLFLAILMSFSLLILLVACANLASMLMARAIARRREIAIRTALGASRRQLVAQLVTEIVVLFLVGAGAAMAVAITTTRAISLFKPPVDVPIDISIPIDARVVGFALGIALVVGAVCGLLPALRATRHGIGTALKEESGTMATRSRLRGALVVGQIAFTLVMLVSAGLVVRALRGALSLDPGFVTRDLTLAQTDIAMQRADQAASYRMATDWRDHVAAIPGVTSAALTTRAPLGTDNSSEGFFVDGTRVAPDAMQEADWAAVSPEYFETMGIRLAAGRAFSSVDGPDGAHTAIVSVALARRYFGSPDAAVGRTLRLGAGDSTRITIVGVAADTKVRSLVEEPRTMLYQPLSQVKLRDVVLLARSSTASAGISAAMRRELRAINPDLPLLATMPYEQYIGVALLPQRIAALMATILGIAGLLLSVVGVYGIVAYAVSQRTREIGIRMAIGATASNVVRRMASQGVKLAAAGIAIGVVLSLFATQLLGSFLLGVSPTDVGTFVGIAGAMAVIAVAASAVPAMRAARVNPVDALRS